jgi:hypothetical protein
VVFRTAGTWWLASRVVPDADRAVEDWPGTDGWPVIRSDGEPVAFVPGSVMHVQHAEYRFDARIDRWGGRAIDAADAAPPEVMFLGDSQTFGVGVADAETFTARLSRRFHRPIVNLGIPGSSLTHEVKQLAARHAALERPPVCVIWFFAGNDLLDEMTGYAGFDPASRRRRTAHGPFAWIDRLVDATPIVRDLRVVRVVRNAALTALNEQRYRFTDQFLFLTTPDRGALRSRAEAQLNHDLDDLVALSARLPVRVAFAIVPDTLQVYPAALARRMAVYKLASVDTDYPNRVLRTALAARDIPLVDPTACMKGRGDGLYYRETHLTDAGHAALATCSADQLQRVISPRQ